jgi:hypothetical protein
MKQWAFVLLALALAGCASTPRLGEVASSLKPPGSNARLFVYRYYDVEQSLQEVPVYVNGAEIGGVGPGQVLVCDLPPGTYTIAPRTDYLWPDQSKSVRVEAGQAIYANVGSFWSTGAVKPPFRLAALGSPPLQLADVTVNPGPNLVPIFVVTLQDPQIARGQVGAFWYKPCNAPYAPG